VNAKGDDESSAGRGNIALIANESGFGDVSYFNAAGWSF
jgi:AraC-like DNA-binding protein